MGRKSLPVALTVAGSDSGGGAGIQADLKSFQVLGVHGVCAITCLTAQNPQGVRGIQPATPALVRSQLEAVWEAFPVRAAKTGMLYALPILREVARFFQQHRAPLVVDPVMVATSGARLLRPSAERLLARELIPAATLVTPNVPEAEALAGCRIRDPEEMRTAARRIHAAAGCAVLIKGGHLEGLLAAPDLFFDGRQEWLLETPRIRGVRTHGTGCSYSAAITAYLAQGLPLLESVRRGKEAIQAWIACSARAGAQSVLGWMG